jgi:hypothetical protein
MNGNEISSDLTIRRSPEFDVPPEPDRQQQLPPKPGTDWKRFLLPSLGGFVILGGLSWLLFNRLILPMLMGKPPAPPATPVQLTTPQVANAAIRPDSAACRRTD